MSDPQTVALFERQKQLLDTFLETGAISKAQHDKSLGDLITKMGMEEASEKQNTTIK